MFNEEGNKFPCLLKLKDAHHVLGMNAESKCEVAGFVPWPPETWKQEAAQGDHKNL